MRLEEKQRITEELARKIGGSETIYLTDFTGLSVKAITELRARFREEGIGYRVVKNTLMRRAITELELPDISEHLQGPTGLVLADEDPVLPARVIKDFAKENDNRPVVKVGIVERQTVTPEAVDELAELPPKDALLGAIAGSLTAGVGGIAGVLEAVIRDIAYMIEEVARSREEAG